MNHVKNQWDVIAKARSQMTQDKDDFSLFTARFDAWFYAFLFIVIAFFAAAFFAIIGLK